MAVRVTTPVAKASRITRRPKTKFLLQQRPFCITPFVIHPVLPGETIQQALLQSRVVTDPIQNPLIGWWLEYYLFYVKLTDLEVRDDIQNMVLDPDWSAAATIAAAGGTTARPEHFFAGGAGQINWMQLCLDRIVETYFRDEGDLSGDFTIVDTVPAGPDRTWYLAQVPDSNVLDSVFQKDDMTAQDVAVTVGVDDQITMSEIEQAMRRWETLRAANLTEMQFEDYLRSYGVRVPPVSLHKPEVIRYWREWQYPSNTIDPTNGTPRSAVSWSVAGRADKNRFCREPGFIVGVSVCRPKVYLSNQTGSFTPSMNDIYRWLPAGLMNDARARYKEIADNVGPLPNATDADGYVVDIGDLLTYGEQFVNNTPAELALKGNLVPLPSANLRNKRYITALDDLNNFFVDEAAAAGLVYIRHDGVVSFRIATSVFDVTPRGGALAQP